VQSPQGMAQAGHIATVGADIWVLTEASPCSVPSTHKAMAPSVWMPGVKSGACFAVVSAEDLDVIDVPEVPTAAAAVVHMGSEDWLVVGVCMPWRINAPTLSPHAAPGKKTGPEQWLHVLEQLDEAVGRLRDNRQGMPLVIAGDFNQTLTGRFVGSREGRARLECFLDKYRLSASTADAPSAKPDCPSVDHIFSPVNSKVSTFPGIAEVEGRGIVSDHLGYSIALA
jgi:hypothetical protein